MSLLSWLYSRPQVKTTSQASVRSCHGCTVDHKWRQPARQVSVLSRLYSRPQVETTSQASVALVTAVQSTTSGDNQPGKCRSCHGCTVDHKWRQPARQVSLLSRLYSRPQVETTSQASVALVMCVQSTTSEDNQPGKCRSCHGCTVDHKWRQPARQVSVLSWLYSRPQVKTTSQASVALVMAVQSTTSGDNQPGKCRFCHGCTVDHK